MKILKIGDHITADNWSAEYVVISVHPDYPQRYTLRDEVLDREYPWSFNAPPRGLRINGVPYEEHKASIPSGKTPIERKIAFMQQRWEKRNG